MQEKVATSPWNPAQYNKFQAERNLPFFDLLRLVQPLPTHSTTHALDLGCGTGELTRELHLQLKPTLTLGIDSSESMLKESASFAGSGLSFSNQRIEDFKPSQNFDLVFSNAALQWCNDHLELFSKLSAWVKPGGQLAIQIPANHDYPTHTVALEVASREKYRQHLKIPPRAHPVLNAEHYAEIFYTLGFREQNLSIKVYGHELSSREEVIEWVRGTLLTHYQRAFTKEIFEEFLRDYRNTLFEKLTDQRPFFYPFKRLLMWARL